MFYDNQWKSIVTEGVFASNENEIELTLSFNGQTYDTDDDGNKLSGLVSKGSSGQEKDGQLTFANVNRIQSVMLPLSAIPSAIGLRNIKDCVVGIDGLEYKVFEWTGHTLVRLHLKPR